MLNQTMARKRSHNQTFTFLFSVQPVAIDDMQVPLYPPQDATPETAIVLFPKPIHTQDHPLNRAPAGEYAQFEMLITFKLMNLS